MKPKASSKELGTKSIGSLLVKMGVPAAIGILVMSINFIVDTIFVGRFVGTMGIAAITVVMPISFFFSSIGMAIGVGGASVISRALGAGEHDKAVITLGNMACLTVIMAITVVSGGYFFDTPILQLFGAQGDILAPAQSYFGIVLTGIPCLAWAMMANNAMRAEGKPKNSMVSMLIPAITNIILDPILIVWLDMGLEGAALATTISYYAAALYTLWFFVFGGSELKAFWNYLQLQWKVVREIFSIGFVTLARQGAVSLLTIVLNNALFQYGSELSVAIYGVINRVMMFANFPVLGVTQGFLPIAGYNYGAEQWKRVKDTIRIALVAGTGIALIIFFGVMFFARPLVALFTQDPELLSQGPEALRMVFLATPLITAQLVGSAYFQAVGKPIPALFLTLTKQGFFLVPLVLTLPLFFQLDGVWYAFPVADILAASVTLWALRREIKRNLNSFIRQQAKETEKEKVLV
ncbi:MATE family efflux transporter [Flavilitoribacter nigricans]|uniref:Multidrug export protein MepA n=1 Tax=Flavilitoribacter nigricans (strain ATCC 23147 / DSM 23189 / NBRC 102662 / NCIMB 1420 / SS-2) TaxID=1122177 RepID=A0A2D0N393_FLAN2|nr:MATE family efflux transporter [Flavilitoribacter nigricans]PHN03012.1 MATE family efflux transporter [Flavilitoribacter nigricans DSM 23189 = NBRC 102662]